MLQRIIFHCDCNSFYASVELLKYPELYNKSVAVSGSVDDRHGIILAKNEIAKKYHVNTAETVWEAKRKCPDLILLPPHHQTYEEYYIKLNEIYNEYTDMVEPYGIDESWLDMTGSWMLFGKTPGEVANIIRERIKEKTKLTISVGVSFNKVFAKLGSDYKKPDAVTEIYRENYKEILWPLPVGTMLYVGGKTEIMLKDLGIYTIGDLAAADTGLLEQVFGKQGKQLSTYARGEDTGAVARAGETEKPKSIGNGQTFRRNLQGYHDVRVAVGSLCNEVAARLRRHKLYACGIQVQIKDANLKTISRQKVLQHSTSLAKDLVEAGMSIISENWDYAKPVRMLTITAIQLSELPYAVQTSFLAEASGMNPKRLKLEKSIDTLRSKFGSTVILEGGALKNDIGVDSAANAKDENSGNVIHGFENDKMET